MTWLDVRCEAASRGTNVRYRTRDSRELDHLQWAQSRLPDLNTRLKRLSIGDDLQPGGFSVVHADTRHVVTLKSLGRHREWSNRENAEKAPHGHGYIPLMKGRRGLANSSSHLPKVLGLSGRECDREISSSVAKPWKDQLWLPHLASERQPIGPSAGRGPWTSENGSI